MPVLRISPAQLTDAERQRERLKDLAEKDRLRHLDLRDEHEGIAARLDELTDELQSHRVEVARVQAEHDARMGPLLGRESELDRDLKAAVKAEAFMRRTDEFACPALHWSKRQYEGKHAKLLRRAAEPEPLAPLAIRGYENATPEDFRSIRIPPGGGTFGDLEQLREAHEQRASEHSAMVERSKSEAAALEPVIAELRALSLKARPTKQEVDAILEKHGLPPSAC